MRLSTSYLYQRGIEAVLDQQTTLSRTQLEIASGKRILNPSDDPSGTVRIIDAQEQVAGTEQYQRNNEFVRAELSLEEGALTGVQGILQRVRELMLQANNDTQNSDTRRDMAVEMRARFNELLALANTRNGSGDYLFAGFQVDTEPFGLSGGSVVYSGDQGRRQVQVGVSSQIAASDPGSEVFELIRTGNGVFTVDNGGTNQGSALVTSSFQDGAFVEDNYTLAFSQATPTAAITYSVSGAVSGVVATGTYQAGSAISFNGVSLTFGGTPADTDSFTVVPSYNQSIFDTLDQVISHLETNTATPAGKASLHNDIGEGIQNIDQAMRHLDGFRATIGARVNNLESQFEINENFLLRMNNALSQAQDLDYAEAVSRLNLESVALEAAQKVYVQVQGMSLFDFL